MLGRIVHQTSGQRQHRREYQGHDQAQAQNVVPGFVTTANRNTSSIGAKNVRTRTAATFPFEKPLSSQRLMIQRRTQIRATTKAMAPTIRPIVSGQYTGVSATAANWGWAVETRSEAGGDHDESRSSKVPNRLIWLTLLSSPATYPNAPVSTNVARIWSKRIRSAGSFPGTESHWKTVPTLSRAHTIRSPYHAMPSAVK
jgi:hypothetical protein